MVTSQQCIDRYGAPDIIFERKWMTLWTPPPTIKAMPRRVYCHRHLMPLLAQAIDYIIERGLGEQVLTWDGCFCIRLKKGNNSAMSLHSWGLAVDINAAWNQFGKVGDMSPELIKCFTDAGFEHGSTWKVPDWMHAQIKVLPEMEKK